MRLWQVEGEVIPNDWVSFADPGDREDTFHCVPVDN